MRAFKLSSAYSTAMRPSGRLQLANLRAQQLGGGRVLLLVDQSQRGDASPLIGVIERVDQLGGARLWPSSLGGE